MPKVSSMECNSSLYKTVQLNIAFMVWWFHTKKLERSVIELFLDLGPIRRIRGLQTLEISRWSNTFQFWQYRAFSKYWTPATEGKVFLSLDSFPLLSY